MKKKVILSLLYLLYVIFVYRQYTEFNFFPIIHRRELNKINCFSSG